MLTVALNEQVKAKNGAKTRREEEFRTIYKRFW